MNLRDAPKHHFAYLKNEWISFKPMGFRSFFLIEQLNNNKIEYAGQIWSTMLLYTRLQQTKRIQCAEEGNITNIFRLDHALHTKFSISLLHFVIKKIFFF